RLSVRPVSTTLRPYTTLFRSAWASNGGMVIHFEEELELSDHRNLRGCFRVRAGERYYLSLHFDSPERLNEDISHHLNSPDDLDRSEEHTSELQSREKLVCRLL